jgi:hypothetical protein
MPESDASRAQRSGDADLHEESLGLERFDHCLNHLQRLTAVSSGVAAIRSTAGAELVAPGADARAELTRVSGQLESSRVGDLLRAFPLDAGVLTSLSVAALLGTTLGAIRRSFKVDLIHPDGPAQLRARLEDKAFKARLPVPRTGLPGAMLPRLAILAGASGALRQGLGVDLRLPGCGAVLRRSLLRSQRAGLSSALRNFPVSSGTLLGLGSLSVFAGSLLAMLNGLGANFMKSQSKIRVDAIRKALQPGAGLALAVAPFTSPALAASGLALPDPAELVRMHEYKTTSEQTHRELGFSLHGPSAGRELARFTRILQGEGICTTAATTPPADAELEGASALHTLASGFAGATSLGVPLAGASAAGALSQRISEFTKSGAAKDVQSLDIDPGTLLGLSRLARLGDCLTPEAGGPI